MFYTHAQAKHRPLAVDPEHKIVLLIQEKFKKEPYQQRYKERENFIVRADILRKDGSMVFRWQVLDLKVHNAMDL